LPIDKHPQFYNNPYYGTAPIHWKLQGQENQLRP
jgi:hypothetical protein